MLDSVPFEVATGLALVFFLVATVATGVNQVISRWADTRAKTLWRALEELLTPRTTSARADLGVRTSLSFGINKADSRPTGSTGRPVEDLLATPSISGLDPVMKPGRPTKVEDIPPRVFAVALLELARIKGSADTDSIEARLRTVAAAYPDSGLGSFVGALAGTFGNDLDRYLDTAGDWFDGQMSQLSRIYRKNARWVLLGIGVIAAVIFNIDAIEIGTTLRDDANVRAGVILVADEVVQGDVTTGCEVDADADDRDLLCAKERLEALNGLKLPVLGEWNRDTWTSSWDDGWIEHLVGLLLAAGAVSLGAPFWFDALRWLAGRRGPGRG